MADVAAVFEDTRKNLADFLRGLTREQLNLRVPATPKWTIRHIASHLAGDASGVIVGDFPKQYFAAFGEPEAVRELNLWTDQHVEVRRDRSLEEVLEEWETASRTLLAMMSGDSPWPDGIPDIAGTVLITDLGAHQQDIYGALGMQRDREGAPVRIGTAGYVAMMGFRLPAAGIPPLQVEAGESVRVSGEGDPGAIVRGTRFELFRALSGRRSPDQIEALDWEGDAKPYVPYFYPYGMRQDALVE